MWGESVTPTNPENVNRDEKGELWLIKEVDRRLVRPLELDHLASGKRWFRSDIKCESSKTSFLWERENPLSILVSGPFIHDVTRKKGTRENPRKFIA